MAWLWLLCVSFAVPEQASQTPPPAPKTPSQQGQQQATPEEKEQLPPEEDEAAKGEQYSFNPLKSKKDVSVGDFYLKSKKDARAAANRYRSATKWNENNAEAWLKLAEMDARPDVANRDEAKAAYLKYLELAPAAKNAGEVRRKLASL